MNKLQGHIYYLAPVKIDLNCPRILTLWNPVSATHVNQCSCQFKCLYCVTHICVIYVNCNCNVRKFINPPKLPSLTH